METTLNTLKNLYAQERGYVDWRDLYYRFGKSIFDHHNDEFIKHENAMFILAQKAALEKAAEKGYDSLELFNSEYEILSKAITNPENLIR